MMKIIFFQSTFTGIGSSFLSVETKLKLFSFIQSLNIVCAIMNDGIGSGCYGNWRQLATNSYLHLQTISNDTCLFFVGFLKSHFLKQEIRFFMQQKKKRLIIFNYIYTNSIPYVHTTYYSFYGLQYYEIYKHDISKEYMTTQNIFR